MECYVYLVVSLVMMCFVFHYQKLPSQGFVKKVGHSLSQWIHLGGVKAFADGSLGSNSALFYEVRTYFYIPDLHALTCFYAISQPKIHHEATIRLCFLRF